MDKETLRLVCAPKDEASMLTQYEHFGWVMADRKEIFNSQEVFDYSTTFSYRGNSGTSIHTHNEVCHFISYLLQRNRDMDDYVNISMIEISYWNKRNEYLDACQKLANQEKAIRDKSSKSVSRYSALSVLCAVGAYIFLMLSILLGVILSGGYFAFLIFVALFIGLFVWLYKKYKEARMFNDSQVDNVVKNATLSQKDITTKLDAEVRALWASVPKIKVVKNKAVIEEKTSTTKALTKEEKLKELIKFHKEGLIDDAEFKERKNKLLE